MRVCIVVGTRPEIVKMASVIKQLEADGSDFTIIHSGQHYNQNMSEVFFKELDLPVPDTNLEIGSGSPLRQMARALTGLDKAFRRVDPDTVLAAALASTKLGIDTGHVEAGLRSYDLRMPEEHNRRLTDHLSHHLFAPTGKAASILRMEHCRGRIYVTGNTVIDACLLYGSKAEKARVSSMVEPGLFALATAHRAENVDDPRILREIFKILVGCPLPVVFPIHPRTRSRFRSAGLLRKLESSENIILLPPVGYINFLWLMIHCQFIITDSGGIQEEATAPNIMKKVFVVRESTERPEAVEAGYAEVVGTKAAAVLRSIRVHQEQKWSSRANCPYGNSTARQQIVRIILRTKDIYCTSLLS